METQLINSISELQDREKKLQSDFHNLSPELKKQTLTHMEELTRTRIQIFTTLKDQYAHSAEQLSEDMQNKVATLNIVEQELNLAQAELRRLNSQYVDKMRMVEISTYFSEKYKAYNGFFFLILRSVIPVILLLWIARRNPVPDSWVSKDNSNTIFLVLMLVIGLYGLYQVLDRWYDLSTRDNMNFNEYDFSKEFALERAQSKLTPGQDIHDGLGSVASELSDFEKAAEKMHLGCVDSTCCADGTMYDKVKKRCIPAIKQHAENTKNASLTKGAMGSFLDEVKAVPMEVEAFSMSGQCPFAKA
jgi:uncharacterized protein YoxC